MSCISDVPALTLGHVAFECVVYIEDGPWYSVPIGKYMRSCHVAYCSLKLEGHVAEELLLLQVLD